MMAISFEPGIHQDQFAFADTEPMSPPTLFGLKSNPFVTDFTEVPPQVLYTIEPGAIALVTA